MQLVLPVNTFHKQNFENYIPGDNIQIVSHLNHILSATEPPVLASQSICVVSGAQGVGKTHLCLATQARATILAYKTQYFDMHSLVNMPTSMAEGMGENNVLCLDNIDALVNNDAWQEVVFDAINQFLENKGRLLLISLADKIASFDWQLKDLKTRLQWGTAFTIEQLNDQQKILALESFANGLGFAPQKNAMAFLISRVSRNMKTLTEHLRLLDKESLEQKRKITIPFIKDTLKL